MKKLNYFVYFILAVFFLSGCQDVKKGFGSKKLDQGNEFLVIKKNPLVVPPDFEKMPIPKNEIDKTKSIKIENDEGSGLKKLLKTQDRNFDTLESKENTGDLEKKIIDKIK